MPLRDHLVDLLDNNTPQVPLPAAPAAPAAPPVPPPMPSVPAGGSMQETAHELITFRVEAGNAMGNCPSCGREIVFPAHEPGAACKGCNNVIFVDEEATLASGSSQEQLRVFTFVPEETVRVNMVDFARHMMEGRIYIGREKMLLNVKLSMAAMYFKLKRGHTVAIDIATIRGYYSELNPMAGEALAQMVEIDIPVIGELIQLVCKYVGKLLANILHSRIYAVEDANGMINFIGTRGKSDKVLAHLERRRQALYLQAGKPVPALEVCEEYCLKSINSN